MTNFVFISKSWITQNKETPRFVLFHCFVCCTSATLYQSRSSENRSTGWLITSQNLDAGNFPPRKRFVQSPSLWYITPSFPKWQNCIFPMKSQSENIVLKFCVVTSPVKEKMRWSRIMTLSSAWDNAPDPMFIMDRLLSVAQVSLGVCRNELILSEQEVGKLGAEKSKPRQRGHLGKFSSI